jgi:hypothetical protein
MGTIIDKSAFLAQTRGTKRTLSNAEYDAEMARLNGVKRPSEKTSGKQGGGPVLQITDFYFVPTKTDKTKVSVIVQKPGLVYAVPKEILVGQGKIQNLSTAVLRECAACGYFNVSDLYGRTITYDIMQNVTVDGVRIPNGVNGLAIAWDPHGQARTRHGIPVMFTTSKMFKAMCEFMIARNRGEDKALVDAKMRLIKDAEGKDKRGSCDRCSMCYRIPREAGDGQSSSYHRNLPVSEINDMPYQGNSYCTVLQEIVDTETGNKLKEYCKLNGVVDGNSLTKYVGFRDSGIGEDSLGVMGPIRYDGLSTLADSDKWAFGTGCLFRVFRPFSGKDRRSGETRMVFASDEWYLPMYEVTKEFVSLRLGGMEFVYDKRNGMNGVRYTATSQFVAPNLRVNPRPRKEE